MKEKIEKFVDGAIKNNDYQLLDILWILSYSKLSMSSYHNKELSKKCLGKVCTRNLQIKYNLKLIDIKEKIKIFIDFFDSMSDFCSRDDKSLREVLISKSSKILVNSVKNKMRSLSDLDEKILSFALNYIPIRIQDSIKVAEDYRQKNPNYTRKYDHLKDFDIITNAEGEIDYFKINPKEWTYVFNQLFDEELKEQLGDELAKIGIGYWVFYISSKGYVNPDFIIPNFIYEDIKSYKVNLPIVENFKEKLKERENKRIEKEWGLEEIEETEAVSEISEAKIEKYIISHLEVLGEDGLEPIRNQFPTSVGKIDILCKDKNGNFVVIELKKGKDSDRVVSQIQRYMVWVDKELAKDKQVRGIIVVREADTKLETALEGSIFKNKIKIKEFGLNAPTKENTKYCGRCGKIIEKSAKHCSKCGYKVWMH